MATAACTNIQAYGSDKKKSPKIALTIAYELFNSLFIVSAGAGGCTGASRVSSKSVVNLLPQLLCGHLWECRILSH